MEDPQFVAELKVRYSTLRKTTLSNDYLMHYIDSVNTVISAAEVRHFRKWPILGQNVGAPESDYIPTTFEGETNKFKSWISTRLAWLDKQLLVPLTTGPEIPSAGQVCRIFPNPAHDILNIDSNMQVESLQIYSYTGMLVQADSKARPAPFQLNISGLIPGIYIMNLKLQDGRTISRKLIIN